jgi:hypothetical protein
MEVVAMMSSQGLDAMLGMVALLGLLVMAGIAIKTYDKKRRREDEALGLQARMADALMAEPRLSGLAVTPTVRSLLWGRPPVTVEISGLVPRPELRELAIRVVMRAMSDHRTDFRIEDRIVVNPYVSATHAA